MDVTAWIAGATGVQAIATTVLVLITWRYVRLIGAQSRDTARLAEATERSVELLVERERRETIESLRILHQAMERLMTDALHWSTQNVVNLVWTHSFPEDRSFALANESELLHGAAKLGGEIEQSVSQVLQKAQTARTRLSELRSLQSAVNERDAQERARPFRAEIDAVHAAANYASQKIRAELERLGAPA